MGEFAVVRRMAIGGMAELFLGRRDGMSGFDKLVVIKRILPQYAHNQDFVRMFLNEARIAGTLHHTNIVQVHSIGEEAGEYFFAMEFLHGEDLSRVLSRATQTGHPLALDSVLTIMSGVCAGLHYAHERRGADGRPLGIVHRDVSPHNVFVTYDGGVKLVDFGIAKATTSIGKTRTGVLKGKVAYMSPEQAYSQPVDRRSDIFCIGILLWELTTGRRLYRRRSELETLKALVDHDAPSPSTIVWGYPTELERIVMKCLARDPAQRWATCDELGQALEAFAQSQNVQVSPTMTARMMRGLFDTEITAFRNAMESGGSLVDHIVARIQATTSRSSLDEWDADVDSIIVDMSAVAGGPRELGDITQTDARIPLLPGVAPPESGPVAAPPAPAPAPPPPAPLPPPNAFSVDDPRVAAGAMPLAASSDLTPLPPAPPGAPALRAVTPLPGVRPMTPVPMQRAMTPVPRVATPAPGTLAPVARMATPPPGTLSAVPSTGVIPRSATPFPLQARATPDAPMPRFDGGAPFDEVAPRRGRRVAVIGGVAVAVAGVIAFVALRGGDQRAPAGGAATESAAPAPSPAPAPPPTPVEPPTAVAPTPAPAVVPTVPAAPPEVADTAEPDPVAEPSRPEPRPHAKAEHRPKPRPKRTAPKRTEKPADKAKPPTTKDLDSLPI